MDSKHATERLAGAPTSSEPSDALLLLHHDRQITQIRLPADHPVVIGRDSSANVVLQDASISRSHARLRFDGQLGVVVEDLKSTNGTLLRGHNLDKPTTLTHGAEIYFGAILGILHIPSRRAQSWSAEDVTERAAHEGDLIMLAPAMRETLELVRCYGDARAPVVITGETGTGKEEVAKLIHRAGCRKDKPFVVVNCAALPAQLLESHLFGHEKGSFTGALAQSKGYFEEAHGGTLLLDEIGELSLPAQAALLRVIETGKLARVGSAREIDLDFRLIAATWRDLQKMCTEGTFRTDLYHRIHVLVVNVPPLRLRREDIPALVGRFLQRANNANRRHVHAIDDDALKALIHYDWPGNIRELRNGIERAVVVAKGERIRLLDLPPNLHGPAPAPKMPRRTLQEALDGVEKEMIEEALRQTNGDTAEAADVLGIDRRTIQRRMQQHGIRAKRGEDRSA